MCGARCHSSMLPGRHFSMSNRFTSPTDFQQGKNLKDRGLASRSELDRPMPDSMRAESHLTSQHKDIDPWGISGKKGAAFGGEWELQP